MKRTIAVTVNGAPHRLRVSPETTLLELVRGELGLTGAKEGCGVGVCGACTVLVDGRPVSACLYLAAHADGSRLTTVEGLAQDGELSPVQAAFVELGASQCGYCTPGMVMAVTALLAERPNCSSAEAREYLNGNLCRCGCHYEVLQVVRRLSGSTDAEASRW